ncbi:MAG: hypothetical protein ABR604_00760 [Jatrophihabitantaceae bacterium]
MTHPMVEQNDGVADRVASRAQRRGELDPIFGRDETGNVVGYGC